MFFHGVELSRGRLGATRLVSNRVGCGKLIGIRISPPNKNSILTDKEFQQIPTVIICRHCDLIPCDSYVVPISSSRNILRWTVHIAPNGLQVEFLIGERFYIADYVHNRRRDPAEIIQLVEFDVQPIAIHISLSRSANISWE